VRHCDTAEAGVGADGKKCAVVGWELKLAEIARHQRGRLARTPELRLGRRHVDHADAAAVGQAAGHGLALALAHGRAAQRALVVCAVTRLVVRLALGVHQAALGTGDLSPE